MFLALFSLKAKTEQENMFFLILYAFMSMLSLILADTENNWNVV